MAYKFEQLDVWKFALDYIDLIYKLAQELPRSEEYNLKSQIIQRRAYLQDEALLNKMYEASQLLAKKLQSFRKSLANSQHQVREDIAAYGDDVLI